MAGFIDPNEFTKISQIGVVLIHYSEYKVSCPVPCSTV